eukprot:2244840-Prymnesium_polylepis.3
MDNDYAVHSDIVHDGGPRFEDPNVLLLYLIELVAGHAAILTGCNGAHRRPDTTRPRSRPPSTGLRAQRTRRGRRAR